MSLRISLLSAALSLVSIAAAYQGPVIRVSVNSACEESNGPSSSATLSEDGRFVAFLSKGSNLVANDTNDANDVFVHDRQTGTTKCISLNRDGIPAGGAKPRISANGRYVVFSSTGMLTDETYTYQGQWDVYVWDAETGQITRENVSTDGTQAQVDSWFFDQYPISSDGRYLCFSDGYSFEGMGRGVFVRDRLLKTTVRVDTSSDGTPANGESSSGWISDDGRYVSFASEATNLVAGDSYRYHKYDMFLKDRLTNETIMVSRKPNGGFSGNGWVRHGRISGSGSCVVFNAFLYDTLIWPADGWFHRMYRYDIATRKLSRPHNLDDVSAASPGLANISADGRMINFGSDDPKLVVGDTNSVGENFIWDSLTGTIRFGPGPGHEEVELGPSGQIIAFVSSQSDLVTGDTNNAADVFVQDIGPGIQMTEIRLTRPVLAGRNRTLGLVHLDQTVRLPAAITLSDNSSRVTLRLIKKFMPGSNEASFVVYAAPVSTATTVIIKARFGSQELTTPLTLVPLVPSAFEFSPRHVTGGSDLSARLVLNGVTDSTGLTLTLGDNSAFAQTPPELNLPGGATQGVFSITTLPVTATQYVTLTASVPQGSRTGHFVIRPS